MESRRALEHGALQFAPTLGQFLVAEVYNDPGASQIDPDPIAVPEQDDIAAGGRLR